MEPQDARQGSGGGTTAQGRGGPGSVSGGEGGSGGEGEGGEGGEGGEEIRREHPQVLTAALTFSIGLLVVRLFFTYFGQRSLSVAQSGLDPLLCLGLIALAGTLGFAVLRGTEGDFLALFLITLILFALQELGLFVARSFWMAELERVGNMLAFGCCIFGSLALIASIYDSPGGHTFLIQLWVACIGMLLLSGFRILSLFPLAQKRHFENYLGIVVLVLTIGYLVKTQWSTARAARLPHAARQRQGVNPEPLGPAPGLGVPAPAQEPGDTVAGSDGRQGLG